MQKQYHEVKANYPDCILFFRLGDFYEMFYEDAKKASQILDLVLTARRSVKSGKVPMCGIPYHAADNYITKLIKAGFKVAICEQVEDPAQAKGLVKRGIVRIVTSGTFIDENSFESRYLLALIRDKNETGLAFVDPAIGTIHINQYPEMEKAIEVIAKLSVSEIIFPVGEEDSVKEIFNQPLLKGKGFTLTPYVDWAFNSEMAEKSLCEHFHTRSLAGFGIKDIPLAVAGAGALLEYLKEMNRQPMLHVDRLSVYTDSDYLFISPAACYGLELEVLVKTIDHTLTPLGKRKLRGWSYHPLKEKKAIQKRQQAVSLLRESPEVQEGLVRLLRNMPDMEKNLSRISCGYAAAKDLLALRNVLVRVPEIEKVLTPLAQKTRFFLLEDIPELRTVLEEVINPEMPLANAEGKIIRTGYHKELDALRDIQENGRQGLKKLQAEEIKRTGINSLKVGYNRVFGYYIEVSKPNLHLVPADYIRKQTLVNGERFITPALKEFEEKMLTAQEEVIRIEAEILQVLQKMVLENSVPLHILSTRIAELDVIYSLSQIALQSGYVLPEITEGKELIIKDGRHPVVEKVSLEPFVPNDALLDCQENHLLVITGPNMSGKSTYIRQVALLIILAQMGSYIPAASASIGVVDKIFTRIGARDEISKGQSTFMVEMSETAGILNNLSERSLVVLDEIGRGTSTYDGLSLAWAVAEHLQKHRVKTLFATHFHELTALAEEYPGVKNYNVEVKEWGKEIVFLHRIIPGGTDDSYGIYVAKLAGIPKEVIKRSQQILRKLELQNDLEQKMRSRTSTGTQLPLFLEREVPEDPVVEGIKTLKEIEEEMANLDLNSLTPLTALNKIAEWKEKIKNAKQT